MVGGDGHREDFDAQVLGLVDGVLQAPTRLLVALQGVPIGHHNQVLVLLQVGAPARGWAVVRPPQAWPPPAPSDPDSSGHLWNRAGTPKTGGEEPGLDALQGVPDPVQLSEAVGRVAGQALSAPRSGLESGAVIRILKRKIKICRVTFLENSILEDAHIPRGEAQVLARPEAP